MAPSLWAPSLVFLGTCSCWALASGGTSSAMVGLLATSRSLSPSSWHANRTGSSSASAARVGASSASWSLPITSSFLPSSAPPFSTTTESPSSYLKNHATSYSLPTVQAGSKDPAHKLSSANLLYTGSPSSHAAYAAAAYYATSSTSTTTTTTTPRPFSYNLPYSPVDHYFDRNTAGSGGHKASATFKHGTSSFKQPSSGGGGYYTSEDYEDEEDDRDEARRDRYHLTRNDALKPSDYDSAETSPPTYVKTKYGYTARNPLLMTSESSKVLSGVSRGDVDKSVSASSGGGNRLGDKDVGDKTYATASSDHYDYKGGFVAADYADDFGFPDLDPHYLPYLQHRRKHHSGKGPLALLLGLLPLGLLMAALVPSVINLPVAAVGAVGAAGRRRREAPSYRNPILDSIAKFGVNSLEDPLCLQRIFCEVTAQGKAPESLPVQKVFYTLSTLVNDLWAERLGLKVLFGAVKKGQCEVFRCKAAKPTKRGKHRSNKSKNKDASAKKAPKE
ncbi:uncharacterized protein DDB_G0271670 [Rhipicephalus sanguineus]|uniref:Uncharacterized protein n=1 Tax=Rhipicephalus sanguineus TaxID=34632 RepID=A0A9D4Q9J9_RHISA|nr:uncharacterized protein DDB_G0271670 [Rhipicephalus sanguineus]KAH7972276.1 hypothetical protein HPB52_010775 [Rhipicephalus sanguineus]